MNDLAEVQDWTVAATGRHAFDEDAVLTPIFSALRRAGWPRRQHEPAAAPDPVDAFRRDPLTAPIPVQALVPAPSRSGEVTAPAEGRVDMADRGRHHHRREPVGAHR